MQLKRTSECRVRSCPAGFLWSPDEGLRIRQTAMRWWNAERNTAEISPTSDWRQASARRTAVQRQHRALKMIKSPVVIFWHILELLFRVSFIQQFWLIHLVLMPSPSVSALPLWSFTYNNILCCLLSFAHPPPPLPDNVPTSMNGFLLCLAFHLHWNARCRPYYIPSDTSHRRYWNRVWAERNICCGMHWPFSYLEHLLA